MDKLVENLENFNLINFSEPVLFSDLKINILYARFMHTSSDNWNTDNHRHSYYELHIPLDGECEILVDDSTTVLLKPNRYMLIHPQTYHRFKYFSRNCLRLSFAFYTENADEYVANTNTAYSHSCSKTSCEAMKSLLFEYMNLSNGYESMITSYVQQILVECLRSSRICTNANTEYVGSPSFQRALQFIKYNMLSDIDTADVAEYCRLSSRQLNRIFKVNMNLSVSKYLRLERIKTVKLHLKNSNLSLKEIAVLSGFSDEYVLSKAFLRETGMSPGQYRIHSVSKQK